MRDLKQTITITEADLYEQGDASVKYHLRSVDFDTANRIAEAMKLEHGQDRLFVFLDSCLVGWEGIVSDGQPAPCTPETKRLLDTEVADALCTEFLKRRQEWEAARRASFRPPA